MNPCLLNALNLTERKARLMRVADSLRANHVIIVLLFFQTTRGDELMRNNRVLSIGGQRSRAVLHWAIIVAAMTITHHARGRTIPDVAYFTRLPHTLITFEQRGNGNPTPVANATPLPANEYVASGFTFAPGLSPGVAWINDPSPSTDAAQALGGSLQLAVGATDNQGDFFIHFTPRPVSAFGFWVQHSNERLGIPTFDAIGAHGILESAFFTGSVLDGTFGNIDYGFLGIAVATIPIQTIHVRGDVALLDNFRFIAVPEPAGSVYCWFGCLAIGRLAAGRSRDVASNFRRCHSNTTRTLFVLRCLRADD